MSSSSMPTWPSPRSERLGTPKSEASGSPCLSVLGPILTLFKSYLGQNARPRAGAQHMLNVDCFKRIDALNFSMISDDGLTPENLSKADIVLIG